MKYKAILADPPWSFKTYSEKGKGRSADRHYRCMSIEAIKALPVSEVADNNSVLFLWTTMPFLLYALEVARAWGFTYKTVGFVWAKPKKQVGLRALFEETDFVIGTGYWTRANTEPCLLATRGHPHRTHKDVRQLIVASRTRHSEKPQAIYERIERLVDGPYLELFARQKRAGWHSWGDEIESDITL